MPDPLRQGGRGARPTEIRLIRVEGIDEAVQRAQDRCQGDCRVAVFQTAECAPRDVRAIGHLDGRQVLHAASGDLGVAVGGGREEQVILPGAM
jgi:hypothetical protein